MIEETKTVFDKLNESMATIAEELNNSNTLFYGTVATLLELTDKLNALNAKLDDILTGKVQIKIQTTIAEGEQVTKQVIETAPKTELQLPTGKEKKK